jgi:hypothetical protein
MKPLQPPKPPSKPDLLGTQELCDSFNTRHGDEVVFLGENGQIGEADRTRKILTVGNTYKVKCVSDNGWSTELFLVGYNQAFNSTMFSPVPKE